MLRFAVLFLIACTTPKPNECVAIVAPSGRVVARVGTLALTTELLRSRMEGGRERYADPKELRAFVDNQIRFELLANEALKQGLDRDPEVQDAAKRAMVQKLIERRLENPAGIDDAAVQREYERTISDYRQPERAQVSLFKTKSAADATAVWRALSGGLVDPQALAELRKKHTGEEPNRDLELKYWSEDELKDAHGAELAKAVFAVQHMGDVGRVGLYVFKLTGRRAAFSRSLADVTPGLKQKLARQERNAIFDSYVDGLRNSTEVTFDESALKDLP